MENMRKSRGPSFPPYNQTARTHARTNETKPISRLGLCAPPPNLRHQGRRPPPNRLGSAGSGSGTANSPGLAVPTASVFFTLKYCFGTGSAQPPTANPPHPNTTQVDRDEPHPSRHRSKPFATASSFTAGLTWQCHRHLKKKCDLAVLAVGSGTAKARCRP